MNIKHINEEWSANNKMNILLIDNTNLFLTERTRTNKKYSCSTHQFRQKNQNKCNKYFWNIFNKSECNKKKTIDHAMIASHFSVFMIFLSSSLWVVFRYLSCADASMKTWPEPVAERLGPPRRRAGAARESVSKRRSHKKYYFIDLYFL